MDQSDEEDTPKSALWLYLYLCLRYDQCEALNKQPVYNDYVLSANACSIEYSTLSCFLNCHAYFIKHRLYFILLIMYFNIIYSISFVVSAAFLRMLNYNVSPTKASLTEPQWKVQ